MFSYWRTTTTKTSNPTRILVALIRVFSTFSIFNSIKVHLNVCSNKKIQIRIPDLTILNVFYIIFIKNKHMSYTKIVYCISNLRIRAWEGGGWRFKLKYNFVFAFFELFISDSFITKYVHLCYNTNLHAVSICDVCIHDSLGTLAQPFDNS